MGWKKYKPKGYYRVCPLCGASLDPGEICDCGVSEYVFSGEESILERYPTPEIKPNIHSIKLPESLAKRPDIQPVKTERSHVIPKKHGNERTVKENFAKRSGKWFFSTTT